MIYHYKVLSSLVINLTLISFVTDRMLLTSTPQPCVFYFNDFQDQNNCRVRIAYHIDDVGGPEKGRLGSVG